MDIQDIISKKSIDQLRAIINEAQKWGHTDKESFREYLSQNPAIVYALHLAVKEYQNKQAHSGNNYLRNPALQHKPPEFNRPNNQQFRQPYNHAYGVAQPGQAPQQPQGYSRPQPQQPPNQSIPPTQQQPQQPQQPIPQYGQYQQQYQQYGMQQPPQYPNQPQQQSQQQQQGGQNFPPRMPGYPGYPPYGQPGQPPYPPYPMQQGYTPQYPGQQPGQVYPPYAGYPPQYHPQQPKKE